MTRLPLRKLGAVVSAVLALGACGAGPKSGSPVVHSFDEIRASEVAVGADPSDPTRAILHVTTKVPAICAIVWGTDATFGRLNSSLVMNGTGITQHDVILPNVKPGTTYRYVVEGTAADGTLYRSGMNTFRTDSTASGTTTPASLPGTDITGMAQVTHVSSEYSPAFAGANAIDGNATTEWATNGDGNDGSITLDLGTAVEIKGVEFTTRSMADGSAIVATYTVTIDGAATPLGPFAAGTTAEPHAVAFTAHGRTLRFDVLKSSGGNVGAVDIRVYG